MKETLDRLVHDFGPRSEAARRAVSSRQDIPPDAWRAVLATLLGQDFEQSETPLIELYHAQSSFAALLLAMARRLHPSADSLLADEIALFHLAEDVPYLPFIAQRLEGYDPSDLASLDDPLGMLYHTRFPRQVRHALGEFYTPAWLADHLLDLVGYDGDPTVRLIDPSCGSGTFLIRALTRMAEKGRAAPSIAEAAVRNLVGIDLHPLAVFMAKVNFLLFLRGRLGLADLDITSLPIHRRDSILEEPLDAEPFDLVLGNPPWITWDKLPDNYRRATLPHWQRLGLFSLSGDKARHGGAKKDLAMLMLYRAAEKFLKPGGQLAMVITQTLLQTRGAGNGFRRMRLGDDGPSLRVLRVDDFGLVRPFHDVAARTAVLLLEKGRETEYPVPYHKWSAKENASSSKRTSRTRKIESLDDLKSEPCLARPVDKNEPGSPWLILPAGSPLIENLTIGPSDYTAHLGANCGGASGVYWIEPIRRTDQGILIRNLPGRGKRAVEQVEAVIEPDCIHPLIRWKDVATFDARPSGYMLIVQDPVTRTGFDLELMRSRYPKTLAYIEQFEELLRSRAAFKRLQSRGPFYSMYNVGEYTFAQHKVVWRRMDRQLRPAVIGPVDDPLLGPRTLVPQETCALIACQSADEAYYLCGLLASTPIRQLVEAHSVEGGKGFGSPGILEYLGLKRFDEQNPQHQSLVKACRQAYQQKAEQGAVETEEIDKIASEILGKSC